MMVVAAWPKQKLKAAREVIEWELKTYPATVKQINDLMAEIEEIAHPAAVGFGSIGRGNGVGDPTPQKAERIWNERERLLSGTQYCEVVRRINAIERVLDRFERRDLTAKLADLVRVRFFKGGSKFEVMQELHISERTYYRHLDLVIGAIAQELGFVI